MIFYVNNISMKNKRLLFSFFLIIPLFFSCNKNIKVNTLYALLNESERKVINIDKEKLDTLMERKATFILVQTTTSCGCSDAFIEIVNSYVKRDGLLIYSIDYNEIKKTSYNFSIRASAPTFHVVKDGNNIFDLEKIENLGPDTFFTQYDSFANYMDAHIAKPSIYYVKEDELDELYNKDEPFAVYFAKSNCLECDYLKYTLLNQYAQTHLNMKKMYIFDFSKQDEERFDELRNKYGLSYESNNTWGYGKGALPLIQYIEPKDKHSKNNSIVQAFTFGNDILNNECKVIKSYYDESRIKNITYTTIDNQVGKQYDISETIISDNQRYLNNNTNEKIYKNAFVDFYNYLNKKLN